MTTPFKFNYLTYHAANYLWANPKQDNQSIQKAQRISPQGGYRNQFMIQYRCIDLPNKQDINMAGNRTQGTNKFHIYQIGQLQPDLLGLFPGGYHPEYPDGFAKIFPEENHWIRSDEIMEKSQMILDVYTANGIMIPKCRVYYRWTDRRNLLFAVEYHDSIPWDFDYEDLYFRVYSGAYFNVLRRQLNYDFIKVKSLLIKGKEDIQSLEDFRNQYQDPSYRGHLFIYVNGVLRFDYTSSELKVGDIVDLIYDSTIYKKLSLKLTDLRTFDSILDKKRKYLITYANPDTNPTIDYHDDIDFFIVRKNGKALARHKGVYYHRNLGDSVRQLTHRDYSIVVPYVKGYLDHDNLSDKDLLTNRDKHANRKIFQTEEDVYVNLYIRRSGHSKPFTEPYQPRPLVYNAHKIHELYKLPFSYRLNAFLGVRSNVTEWRADILENSDYMKLVSAPDVVYDSDIVEKAYGYHAISQLTGYSPTLQETVPGTPQGHPDRIGFGNSSRIELRHNLQKASNHWEFDDKGILLGYYNHYLTCDYYIRNKDTTLVEHLSGTATDKVDTIYDPFFLNDQEEINTIDIPIDEEYRLYRCKKGEELKPLSWEDITLSGIQSNLYSKTIKDESNGIGYPQGIQRLTWLKREDLEHYTYLLRRDNQVLAYQQHKSIDNGLIDFILAEQVSIPQRDPSGKVIKTDITRMKMLVPRGHLDVYLNGHALIRDIDYFIDFPRVIITTKEYFKEIEKATKQVITVRFHGFCETLENDKKEKYLSLLSPKETGYVQFNTMSYNKHFHLRDDNNLSFIIGGAVYDRSILGFSEEKYQLNSDGSLVYNRDLGDIKIPNRGRRVQYLNKEILEDVEGKPYQVKDIIVPMRHLTKLDTYTLREQSLDTEKRIEDYLTQFIPEKREDKIPPIRRLYFLYSPFLSYIIDDLLKGTFIFPKIKEHYSDQDVLNACREYEWLLRCDPVYQDKCIDYNYIIVHPHPFMHVIDLDIYSYRLLSRINRLYMKDKISLSHHIREKKI